MRKTRWVAALAATATAMVIASPVSAATGGVLGPYGYGGVKLGMTAKQAKATGKIVLNWRDHCSRYHFKAHGKGPDKGGLYLSKKRGVAVMWAPATARTPQGVRLGSTLSQVKKAYPAVRKIISGYTVTAPGNRKAYYWFGIERNKVTQLILGLQTQDCVS